MPIRVYENFGEALEDIRFGGDRYITKLLNGGDKFDIGQFSFDRMMDWLSDRLEGRGLNREQRGRFYGVLVDLVGNAYEKGVQDTGEESCTAECFLGQRGVLMGTRQKSNFLRPEQIELLRRGENVPSRDVAGGSGTRLFVKQDGLLIVEEEKAMYVARYFQGKGSS
jgi:hypothetical protein